MLTNEEVLPVCYYWARVLHTKQIPFDELVNEAFVNAKKLKSPLLLQKWVKWTMIHFIQKQKSSVTIDDLPEVEDKAFNFDEFRVIQEELMSVMNLVCSDKEQRLIFLRFWKGLTYEKIAKESGMDFRRVGETLKGAFEKIRRNYERRARNNTKV